MVEVFEGEVTLVYIFMGSGVVAETVDLALGVAFFAVGLFGLGREPIALVKGKVKCVTLHIRRFSGVPARAH